VTKRHLDQIADGLAVIARVLFVVPQQMQKLAVAPLVVARGGLSPRLPRIDDLTVAHHDRGRAAPIAIVPVLLPVQAD